MNRKHFRKLASLVHDAVRDSVTGDEAEVAARIARGLATLCALDNPRFDYARFYAACGLDATGNLSGHFAHVHSFCNPVSDAAV